MSSYLLFCCIYFDAWFITCCPKREETLKVYRVIAYICYIYFDAWCITCCSKREETLEVYTVIGEVLVLGRHSICIISWYRYLVPGMRTGIPGIIRTSRESSPYRLTDTIVVSTHRRDRTGLPGEAVCSIYQFRIAPIGEMAPGVPCKALNKII